MLTFLSPPQTSAFRVFLVLAMHSAENPNWLLAKEIVEV